MTVGKAPVKHIKANPKNTEITAVRPINQVTTAILDGLRTESDDGDIEHGNSKRQAGKTQKVLQARAFEIKA
ncbi:MAG: hypothetical protein KDE46_02320, partial [Caldilineaceae bacterium]|nr:hypothetical protein [Caldilineaceae bacterium]